MSPADQKERSANGGSSVKIVIRRSDFEALVRWEDDGGAPINFDGYDIIEDQDDASASWREAA